MSKSTLSKAAAELGKVGGKNQKPGHLQAISRIGGAARAAKLKCKTTATRK